jgi:hypothetical protein
MANKEPDNDDIIKYLGFGVHPGKIENFWRSEDEEKQFRQEVKARGGKIGVLDRETAILNTNLMTGVDKIIAVIGSVLLVISFFLPIYSFSVGDRQVSGSAVSFFANLGTIGGYAAWGGAIMVLTMVVLCLILIACPVTGILNILGLLNKKKNDEYIAAVKKSSRYIFIPIALYGLLIFLLLVGAPQPFGSLGVNALGESLSLGAIFTMTGVGFWLNIAGLAIGFAEGRGI